MLEKSNLLFEETSAKKKIYLSFFFNELCTIPEVMCSDVLFDFLNEADIQKLRKKYESISSPTDIYQFECPSGEIKAEICKKHLQFYESYTQNIEGSRQSYEKLSSLINEVGVKSTEVSNLLVIIKNNFLSLCERSKKLNFSQHSKLMEIMSDHFDKLKKSYDNIFSGFNCELPIAFKLMEKYIDIQSDIMRKVNTAHNTYSKAKYDLTMKKEKYYASKNITNCEISEEVLKKLTINDILSDKSKAFGYMFPQETDKVSGLKHLSGYMNHKFVDAVTRFYEMQHQLISCVASKTIENISERHIEIANQWNCILKVIKT